MVRMCRLKILFPLLFVSLLTLSGIGYCSSILKEEAKHFLTLFGYSDSCTSTALEWCDHNCKEEFPQAISDSEKTVSDAVAALQKALDSLQALSGCLKKKVPPTTENADEPASNGEPEPTEASEPGNEETEDQPLEPLYEYEEPFVMIKDPIEFKNDGLPELPSYEYLLSEESHPQNCAFLPESGVGSIYPYKCCPEKQISVFCDQTTDGGGWTIIQRREDLPVRENFYRNWAEYAAGFGDLRHEFWLGLDNIHDLTSSMRMILRIEMENEEGEKKFAEFDNFNVGNSSTKYILQSLGKYSGNAGDSLSSHEGHKFTTYDSDNDGHSEVNCAVSYKGAWWYNACHTCNLNGQPYVGKTSTYADGICWFTWNGFFYSFSKVKMMIRPFPGNDLDYQFSDN